MQINNYAILISRIIKINLNLFINSPVSQQNLIQHTVLGLGMDYESLVTAITHFPGHTTFDDLRAKLLIQEQRVKFLRDGATNQIQHQAFGAQTSTVAATSKPRLLSVSSNSSASLLLAVVQGIVVVVAGLLGVMDEVKDEDKVDRMPRHPTTPISPHNLIM